MQSGRDLMKALNKRNLSAALVYTVNEQCNHDFSVVTRVKATKEKFQSLVQPFATPLNEDYVEFKIPLTLEKKGLEAITADILRVVRESNHRFTQTLSVSANGGAIEL
jgi:hypothetical protein